MKNTLFTILIALFISACASTKSNDNQPLSDIIKDNNDLRFLNIEADIYAGEENASMGISAMMILAGYDSLKIDAFLPFGIQLGKMYSSKDEFVFYNMMQNQVMSGKPSSENLKQTMQISMSLEDLVKFLRSEFPGKKENYYLSEKLSESGNLLYKDISSKEYVNFVLVSKTDGSIIQFQQKTKEGETVLNVHFKDYKKKGTFNLAHNILITSPKTKMNVNMMISDIEVNVIPNEPFKFKVPTSANKIELN